MPFAGIETNQTAVRPSLLSHLKMEDKNKDGMIDQNIDVGFHPEADVNHDGVLVAAEIRFYAAHLNTEPIPNKVLKKNSVNKTDRAFLLEVLRDNFKVFPFRDRFYSRPGNTWFEQNHAATIDQAACLSEFAYFMALSGSPYSEAGEMFEGAVINLQNLSRDVTPLSEAERRSVLSAAQTIQQAIIYVKQKTKCLSDEQYYKLNFRVAGVIIYQTEKLGNGFKK